MRKWVFVGAEGLGCRGGEVAGCVRALNSGVVSRVRQGLRLVQPSGSLRAAYGQASGSLRAAYGQLSGSFRAGYGQVTGSLRA